MIMPRRVLRDLPNSVAPFERGALGERIDRPAIEPLPGRGIGRHGGNAIALAALDLGILDQHVAAPLVEIDVDHIAGAQPGKPAAGSAFGRGVEN